MLALVWPSGLRAPQRGYVPWCTGHKRCAAHWARKQQDDNPNHLQNAGADHQQSWRQAIHIMTPIVLALLLPWFSTAGTVQKTELMLELWTDPSVASASSGTESASPVAWRRDANTSSGPTLLYQTLRLHLQVLSQQRSSMISWCEISWWVANKLNFNVLFKGLWCPLQDSHEGWWKYL